MTTTMLVEDESLFRDMLRISLDSLPGIDVVATVDDGASAIKAADLWLPEVVIMDIDLGEGINGIEAARLIKAKHPDMGVLILSSHNEFQYTRLLASEEFSGWSYVLKQSIGDVALLSRAVEGVSSGLVVMDSAITAAMRPTKNTQVSNLTPRQREVLEMMAQGFTNRAIADRLVLGLKSVENYVNAIYQEMELTTPGLSHPRVQSVLRYIHDCN